jgi:CheY-like chemotaxis protein
VDISSRSPEGLSLAEEGDYSAIVLDINMPKLDGLAFLEQLRETRPDVPVIFITGYPSLPKATSAVRLGASDFVTKPFTPQDITDAVVRSAASFGDAGPEIVEEILDAYPKKKLMVVAPSDAHREAEYRRRKIFYYAVEPVDQSELATLVDTIFCPVGKVGEVKPVEPVGENKGSETLAGVRIRNRLGHRVQLLAEDGLLQVDAGLGKRIREKLLARLLPVETDLAQLTILEAARDYDHLLILSSRDMGRPLGSLVVESKDDLVQFADATIDGRVTTLTIQTADGDDKLGQFSDYQVEALARHITVSMADG